MKKHRPEFAAKLAELRSKAADPTQMEAVLADYEALPATLQPEAWALVADTARKTHKSLLDALESWVRSLKPLFDKKGELEGLRAEVAAAADAARHIPLRKLQALWAARARHTVRADPAVRKVAQQLDVIEAKVLPPEQPWRDRLPLAAVNIDLDTLTIETVARSAEERSSLTRSHELGKIKGPAVLQKLNDYRAMMGRIRLTQDDRVAKLAADQAAAKGILEPTRMTGVPAEILEFYARARSWDDALSDWLEGPAHATLIDSKWTHVGFGLAGSNGYCITLAAPR
jgi:hypothetical protein